VWYSSPRDDDGAAHRFERHGTEGAGGNRLFAALRAGRALLPYCFGNCAQMLRRGAATTADYLHTILGNEPAKISGQLGRGEFVDSVAALVLRAGRRWAAR